MKNFAKIGITLALIASIAAAALAFINSVTAPRIAAYDAMVVEMTLKEVAHDYAIGDKRTIDDDGTVTAVHPLTDSEGATAGYILSLTGNGYGGPFTMMASYLADGTVVDARLLTNSETPGLGKKAENPSYMEKFQGTGNDNPVPQKKDELSKEDADAVGGSTITFTGVSKTLAYGSAYVKELGGK
ncbi:MAG: FMN-binding protein [Sphaerochaetaceae bacterium]|nr:FMN-binding protein [Sphaerochaetaceae bacterium]MDC7247537.1 FMN-binding protein [Sphaerochaetaceae bacterium]